MSTKQERIDARKKVRAAIADSPYQQNDALLLISESLDDYIEHRIETDKVLEGILKDIQGGIESLGKRLN